MSTHASPRIGADDHDPHGAVAPRTHTRRLSTESKAAFKTTEFGYMVSRGLAKSGSSDPYDAADSNR